MDANRYREQTETRVSRLLRGMRQFGKLGQRNGGALSDAEITQMFKVLHEELDNAYKHFVVRPSDPQFRFGANQGNA